MNTNNTKNKGKCKFCGGWFDEDYIETHESHCVER